MYWSCCRCRVGERAGLSTEHIFPQPFPAIVGVVIGWDFVGVELHLCHLGKTTSSSSARSSRGRWQAKGMRGRWKIDVYPVFPCQDAVDTCCLLAVIGTILHDAMSQFYSKMVCISLHINVSISVGFATIFLGCVQSIQRKAPAPTRPIVVSSVRAKSCLYIFLSSHAWSSA